MNESIPRIGAHVSSAGGYKNALQRAEEIGANTMQIFASSPRAWHVKTSDKEDIKEYYDYLTKSNVKTVYIHGSYLVNFGSPNKELLQKSATKLLEDFKITEELGARGLIFHLGSKKGQNILPLDQISQALASILNKVKGKSLMILENAAGGGEKIGTTPEELKMIIDRIGSPRVATCLDTAHAFESGLIDEYSADKIIKLLRRWDEEIGLELLPVLHINDSKTAFNSKNDRHENIGHGYIGINGFRALAANLRLRSKDWILEVPGMDNSGPDKENIQIIKQCFR